MAIDPLPCPVCAALVMDDAGHVEHHVTWHEQTKTLGSKRGDYSTGPELREGFREMRRLIGLVAASGGDYETQKLPPIRETVLRRPPAPEVRELKGAELLRALADELARDDELADELADVERPTCRAALVQGWRCDWSSGQTPCLAYGVPGCGMKAQER